MADNATLPASIVFIKETTRDPQELDLYAEKVSATFEGHDVAVLAAYGAREMLEGPAAEGVVILRFSSMEAASA